jgi:hypothetical protein
MNVSPWCLAAGAAERIAAERTFTTWQSPYYQRLAWELQYRVRSEAAAGGPEGAISKSLRIAAATLSPADPIDRHKVVDQTGLILDFCSGDRYRSSRNRVGPAVPVAHQFLACSCVRLAVPASTVRRVPPDRSAWPRCVL